MGILQIPGEIVQFCFKATGLVLLTMYGLALKFWVFTLRPLLQPVLDLALNIKPEDVTVIGVIKSSITLFFTCILLWFNCVVGVWEVVTRPFERFITKIRQFFWNLQYELDNKPDKDGKTREEWLSEELRREKERREKCDNSR